MFELIRLKVAYVEIFDLCLIRKGANSVYLQQKLMKKQ